MIPKRSLNFTIALTAMLGVSACAASADHEIPAATSATPGAATQLSGKTTAPVKIETAAVTSAEAAPATKRPPFKEWLAAFKAEAIGAGISQKIVDEAFVNVTVDETVIEADKNQPEFKVTLDDYLSKRVTERRIALGREALKTHREALRQVSEAYGVQPRFIVAIWGVETNFGGFTGNRSIIQSLTTLAYDPRRDAYFRKELLAALKILDEGHVSLANMTGSWAGAMGQPQFMPTSFNAYAVDFDKDGRRDIWNTPIDVFASIANYLKRYGWDDSQTWGREVAVNKAAQTKVDKLAAPGTSCAIRNHKGFETVADWSGLGLTNKDATGLPANTSVKGSLSQPDGVDGRAFLAYGNFRSILRYNCSNFYAISVGLLSDSFIGYE